MKLQKHDFIEIEFTGRIKNGEIFDSNIKRDLEKLNPNAKTKPLIFCLGEGMFLKGIDDFLIGKDVGKYTIDLKPEQAFGPRMSNLVQMVPMKVFKANNLNPVQGAAFNFDGRVAKILTVSGGRVVVDFNNPLAGKDMVYEIKVLRKVDDLNEKIKSLINFLFRKDLKFSVKDKKIIINAEKGMKEFIEMFKDKFKDIFGMEIEIKETKTKPEKEAQ